ncbi:MAG: gliding motility-associated C-terminal domain-containing protein [Fluviicola sp.]|nr:gliding motility-associated C-terminal domain-containing protein [Fluviicola sp.]
MKNLLLLLLFVTSWSFGQNTPTFNYVTETQYQYLKTHNGLTGNEVVLSEGMVNPNDYKGTVYVSSYSPEKATGCSGYFPPPGPSLPSTSIDDGWATASPFTLPFSFCFYGNNYNQVWMNNNGNISFNNGISAFSSSAFPSVGNTMIAAFWGDFYLTNGGTMHATITPTAAIFNWVSMGYYSNQNDKVNTCQIVITNGLDPLVIEGNTAIHFADMQWTTGSASSGVGGFLGTPATVGANSGNGTDFIQIGRFDHAGTDYDGPNGNNDGVSWLDNKSFYFDFCTTGNIAPLALQTSYCDTIQVCNTGTSQIVFPFSSPENNQLTHVYVDSTTLLNYTTQDSIVAANGSITVNINGSMETLGVHTLIMSAVDNYSTQDTTTITYYIEIVDGSSFFTPEPIISFNPGCSPVDFTVSGTWDSYSWQETGSGTNPNNTNSTYTIDNAHNGLLSVTITTNGCSYTVDTFAIVNPQPVFNFAGSFDFCSNEFFTQLALSDSALLSSVNWFNATAPTIPISNNFSMSLVNGQYVIEIFDNTGTCSNDTTITISMIPSPAIFIDTFACDFSFQVSNTFSAGGGIWSSLDPEISFNDPTLANPIITSSAVGTYQVSFTDNVCNETLTRSIEFIPYPTIFNDTLICSDTLNIVNVSAYGNSVTWASSDPSNVNFLPDDATMLATVVFDQPGTYNLVMTDKKCLNAVNVDVTLAVLPQILQDTFACDNQLNIVGTVANNGGVWSSTDSEISFNNPNALNPIVQTTTPGVYTVQFTDNSCQLSETVVIDFIANPVVSTFDTLICSGDAVTLIASGAPQNDTYTWSDGTQGISTVASLDGDYIVVAQNECGTATDTAYVVTMPCNIIVPNIIVLSSTAGNNALFIEYDGAEAFELVITNRWGNVVFETTDPLNVWNGTQNGQVLSEGIYSYILEVTLVNGEELTKQGFIHLYH